MTRALIPCPSPNFNARDPAIPLQYIVLHYTGMRSRDEALQRLCDPKAEVSAHYVIDETGAVYSLVDESKRAWHAGRSFWDGVTDLNNASIGIELVNPGHEFGYVPFSAPQIEALESLLKEIIAQHGFDPLRCLLGHSDIAPQRKTDPGELFPWKELAEHDLGFWPVVRDDAAGNAAQLLQIIGYDVTDVQAALLAFQRRFQPQRLSGVADAETLALLSDVARIMKG